MTGFLPAEPTRHRGIRVVLPSGMAGTAYEADTTGRRWCHLDNGEKAWLQTSRLTPVDPADQRRLDGLPEPAPAPPAPASHPCGCPAGRSTITDQARHDTWHAEVAAQGGPTRGPVNVETLRATRGGYVAGSGETYLDVKARATGKRASGALRNACRDDS